MCAASAQRRGAATDFGLACMPLCGWTRSRYVGSRMGVCASRRSGSGLACEHEVWRGAMLVILMIKKDEIAYLLLRLTLGANIFLHGFSRLIGDHAAFAAYMDKQMHNAP